MLKVNNRNTKTRRKTCSKLTIKFEHLTYFTPCSSVSIVDFEKVNAVWVYSDHRDLYLHVQIILVVFYLQKLLTKREIIFLVIWRNACKFSTAEVNHFYNIIRKRSV